MRKTSKAPATRGGHKSWGGTILRQDLEAMAIMFGFQDVDQFEAFVEEQQVKHEERHTGRLAG